MTKITMRNLATALAVLASIPYATGDARAGAEKVGTTAANFLSIGAGPGVLGMGGASLGLPGDLSTAAWNVGSLGWLEETQIVFSHAGLPDATSQEWMSTGGRIGASRTRWGLSGLYQSLGTVAGRDASNNPIGDLKLASMAVGAQLAHPIGRFASVGFGAKWVNEDLGVVHGSGVTFDAGLQIRKGVVGFGLAAQNAFGKMTYSGHSYEFPTNYGAGIAIDHAASGLRFAVDGNLPNAYYPNVRGGVEWRWKDWTALRAGYRSELGAPEGAALSGPSFGMGAGVYGVWVDYGYLISTGNQGQHRMGITWRPGKVAWSPGDLAGQKDMPREFDGALIGPPMPEPRKK